MPQKRTTGIGLSGTAHLFDDEVIRTSIRRTKSTLIVGVGDEVGVAGNASMRHGSANDGGVSTINLSEGDLFSLSHIITAKNIGAEKKEWKVMRYRSKRRK